MDKGEIILYQPNNSSIQLDVRVEEETVWLNRKQLAILFNRDVKTIGKHIANAKKEALHSISVVAKFATTAAPKTKTARKKPKQPIAWCTENAYINTPTSLPQ
jgi:hypothetical protein